MDIGGGGLEMKRTQEIVAGDLPSDLDNNNLSFSNNINHVNPFYKLVNILMVRLQYAIKDDLKGGLTQK